MGLCTLPGLPAVFVQLTDGDADYNFECIGNTKVMPVYALIDMVIDFIQKHLYTRSAAPIPTPL